MTLKGAMVITGEGSAADMTKGCALLQDVAVELEQGNESGPWVDTYAILIQFKIQEKTVNT